MSKGGKRGEYDKTRGGGEAKKSFGNKPTYVKRKTTPQDLFD